MDTPFDLQVGDSITAKVKAINVIGISDFSASGNGATVVTA